MALQELTKTNPGLLSEPGDKPSAPGVYTLWRIKHGITTFLDNERDQWIIWIVIAFAAGAALYFSLEAEPNIALSLSAILAIGSIFYALPTHTMTTVPLGVLMAATIGFTAAKLKTEWVSAPVLKTQGRVLAVTGYIELVEPRPRSSLRLTMLPIQIENLEQQDTPYRIRITLSARMAGTAKNITSGDTISLRARLNAPSGPAIPGGFDFARFAWFRSIGAVGFAVSPPRKLQTHDIEKISAKNSTVSSALNVARAWIKNVRRAIGQRVDKILPGETGAIANALLTGERGAITEATNDAYRGAGLYHILSISGLHMAIMAGSVFFVLRGVLALIPALALAYPIKKWAAAGAIVGALGYLLISGGAFATIRSFIMITIMFTAILNDRPALALRNVALSALVILCVYPESILNAGFQMSFAAVTALIAGFEAFKRWMPEAADGTTASPLGRWLIWPLTAIIMSTIVASLAVTPFAIYHFHNAQHYAVLANVIAMPACNVIVMPAALATLIALPFGLEAVPLIVMGFGIDLMTTTATWVSKIPGAVSHPPALATHAFAGMVTGGIILVVVRQSFRLVGLAIIALAIAIAPTTKLPDILVGRDGGLIAVKTTSNKLAAHVMGGPMTVSTKPSTTTRRPPYELSRWMEHFGDARPPQAALRSKKFRCDRLGCAVRTNGKLVALSNNPASIAEDCKRTNILIVTSKAPRTCQGPQVIIDKYDVRTAGTHAITIENDGNVTVKTVAQSRGNRPWVRQHERKPMHWSKTSKRRAR